MLFGNPFKICTMAISGKGGVGKSSLAFCTALKLAEKQRVGIADLDSTAPNLDRLFGLKDRKFEIDDKNRLYPIKYNGNSNLEIFSTSVWFPVGSGVWWNDSQCSKYAHQFIKGVQWTKARVLIADMPPSSTGSFHALKEIFNRDNLYAVIITTSSKLSLDNVSSMIDICLKKGIRILGVVENLSGELFGEGGGEQLAEEYGLTYFGSIPAKSEYRVGLDRGEPVLKEHEVIRKIVERVEQL